MLPFSLKRIALQNGIGADAKVNCRWLGSRLIEDVGYSSDDEILLEGAFTDDERHVLPLAERATILGIKQRN